MLSNYKKYGLLICVLTLILANVSIFYIDWRNSNRVLTVAVLDVGQGDAIFIESPTGAQILFDAGSPRKILGPLSKVMPFYDKSIDAIVITNPDADHIGSFTEVLKNFKVDVVLEPGTINDSGIYKNLKSEIERQNIPTLLAKKGMRIHIGDGAVIDILFPDRDVIDWSPNDGSVVARLSYGETSVMLTGDASKMTEEIILKSNEASVLKSDILKVGHHGSRTSTSPEFLKAVSPGYALISLGDDNKYGHPHREALDIMASFGARVLRTDQLGSIVIRSDGSTETFSFNK